jgi:signal transduction histidine kinase
MISRFVQIVWVIGVFLCYHSIHAITIPFHSISQSYGILDTTSSMDDESIADIVNQSSSGHPNQAMDTLVRVSEKQSAMMNDSEILSEEMDDDSEGESKESFEAPRVGQIDAQGQDTHKHRLIANKNAESGSESYELATVTAANDTDQQDSHDEGSIDIETKKKAIHALIERGEKYFHQYQPYEALNKFTHDKNFRYGEIYLFVFDQNGTVLAHGEQADLIWQNLIGLQDVFGSPFVKAMIKQAKRGGGWVTYQWRGATKLSYVKEVVKDGTTFVIGAGFYPHSKSDSVMSLVKGAVAIFKQAIKSGKSTEEIFSTLSYPLGRFVLGDLYLYALDFQGVHMAHGDRPGLIGTNAIDYRDSTGKFVNKEIMAKLKNNNGATGIWVDYDSKNAPKRSYAERVTDTSGKEYFIACGYYPDADQGKLIDLVRRGYEYMKGQSVSIASTQFTDKKTNMFRYGDIYLMVFDMTGKVIAHGGNPDFIGQNFYNDKDQDGRYYVREIIAQAKKQRVAAGSGEASGDWVNYKLKNSFVSAYIKPIRLGLKEYVIVSGLFPITKQETAVLLARSGASYLRVESEQKAFRAFVEEPGKFIQGDLYVFVYAFNGICLAYGDDETFIWQNMLNAKDDKNMPYVQVFINTVKKGRGKVTYTLNGVQRVVFIERVDKGGKSYVVGCGYFE